MIRRDLHATFQTGARLHRSGRLAEAEQLYRAVLEAEPRFPGALHLLGVVRGQLGRPGEAVELIRNAIEVHPGEADFYSNLASFLIELKRMDEALDACRRAIALRPGVAEAHLNLGVALMAQDDIPGATAAFARAIEIQPDYAQAHGNLGAAPKDVADLDSAAAAYRKAIAIDPRFADAHWNLGLIHLLRGEFRQGWELYEWRLKLPENGALIRRFSRPRWNGEELGGRTILLITEQGLGDAIQFIRYAPMVAARGGKVLVWAQPALRGVLERVEGVHKVVCEADVAADFDVQCPLLSLPGIFETSLANIPAQMPYVSADPARVEQWARRMGSDRRQRIGLVWAGGKNHKRDAIRSMPASLLAPLARVTDAQFFSLQKGDAASQVGLLPAEMGVIDWTAELGDFAETAGLIANLDLVITVDTAVAHLAGAMGKVVWVLLPFILDWRWMLDRCDSPWYPTMRLFRQLSRGDWGAVVERVVGALGERKEKTAA